MTTEPPTLREAPVRVFISYAWESFQYRQQVKRLATRLRADGIDARLDAWHLSGSTIPDFMNREVRRADKVLVVCSPEYRRKVHAMEDGRVTGVGWEAMLVTADVFSMGEGRSKIEPVLLRGAWVDSALLFIQGLPYADLSDPATFEANYRELIRRLTGHTETAPDLGPLPTAIEPEPVDPLRGGKGDAGKDQFRRKRHRGAADRSNSDEEEYGEETPEFSPPINDFLDKLHRGVRRLTAQQYVVLDFLRHQRRVRISGSAGSGKTLVAAEKALQLSKAHPNVLFLCHNPQLAAYIRSNLTLGTSVQLLDFCSWVRDLAGACDSPFESEWTHFDEPDDATLSAATERLSAGDLKQDAIIVDEAQDFRYKWWAIVEAALGPDAYFYIFHDDNQSLLPRGGSYPDIGPLIDLSKNCRNAKRVFDLMRCFSRTLPETRLPGGRLIFGMYRAGEERKRLSSIINELFTQGLVEKTVILWAGTEPVTESPVANSEFVVSGGTSWRDEVRRQFERVFRMYDTNGLTMPHEESVMEELGGLSESAYPTSDDVRLVQRVANRFSVDRDIRQRIQNIPQFRRGFHWVGSENDLRMRRAAQAPPWGAEIVLHFKDDDWHTGIPAARVVRVVPYYEARSVDSIPLFAVADFKGLESDVVILLMRGGMLAHKEVLYVGISRARAILYLMTDEMGARSLPHPFHWDLDMTWR